MIYCWFMVRWGSMNMPACSPLCCSSSCQAKRRWRRQLSWESWGHLGEPADTPQETWTGQKGDTLWWIFKTVVRNKEMFLYIFLHVNVYVLHYFILHLFDLISSHKIMKNQAGKNDQRKCLTDRHWLIRFLSLNTHLKFFQLFKILVLGIRLSADVPFSRRDRLIPVHHILLFV